MLEHPWERHDDGTESAARTLRTLLQHDWQLSIDIISRLFDSADSNLWTSLLNNESSEVPDVKLYISGVEESWQVLTTPIWDVKQMLQRN